MRGTVAVGIEGEQRGLLGHTVIDGRRYAAWIDVDTLDLFVGEVTSGSVDRLVGAGTGTSSKDVGGGHLENPHSTDRRELGTDSSGFRLSTSRDSGASPPTHSMPTVMACDSPTSMTGRASITASSR